MQTKSTVCHIRVQCGPLKRKLSSIITSIKKHYAAFLVAHINTVRISRPCTEEKKQETVCHSCIQTVIGSVIGLWGGRLPFVNNLAGLWPSVTSSTGWEVKKHWMGSDLIIALQTGTEWEPSLDSALIMLLFHLNIVFIASCIAWDAGLYGAPQ